MPIARITLLEGVDEAGRGRVIAAVTQALVDTLNAPPEAVRVLIEELPPANWGVGGRSIKERQAAQS